MAGSSETLVDPKEQTVADTATTGNITVTWGEEVLQPIQYNGFRVGPLTITAPILPGETVLQAYHRLWTMLDKLGREQFDRKLSGWLERVKAAGTAVRASRG